MGAIKLRGLFTAIVTPMNKDGSLDLGALDALVDRQLAAGVNGLVPCGTTGEAVTLSVEERDQVITRVVRRAGNEVTVVAGAGGNSTTDAVESQKRAKGTGAAAALVATPAYNKPTPEGLYRHYAAITAAVDFPTVVYNVPSRTACDMKPETVARVSKLRGVVGIKEATGDLDRVAAIRALTGNDFAILSGDDGSTCPFLLLGGDGVISVASNVAPKPMVALCSAALAGRVTEARAQHEALRPLFAALFFEANPIPVKAALAMLCQIQESYRLPLCEMSREPRIRLEAVLREGGFLS
ncbi:MAG: 4-hydroxy-tetrahydrodipicolinate synthase [Deltaproteobacteria bacterium]|nr:4-hydroxy-tetrahydrodipicolinate synthase [Deltaproteobacteria bacterium]